MESLLRGGQTTMHSIRMFRQVLRNLFSGAFIVIIISAIYNIYKSSISLYYLKICFVYFYAKLLLSFELFKAQISVANSQGNVRSFTPSGIVNNSNVNQILDFTYGQIIHILISSLQYGVIAFVVLIIFFVTKGIIINQKKIVRGGSVVNSSKLKQQIAIRSFTTKWSIPSSFLREIRDIIKLNLRGVYNIIKANREYFAKIKIGGIPFPSHTEKTHTLITGASGSGKTVLISSLIKQIRKKNQKAIIYDKMGVYTQRFYDPSKGDILLNPLDSRCPVWNIANECKNLSDFDSIAKAFIPEKNSGDPFWESAARAVFAESLKYLKRHNQESNKTLKEIFFSEDSTLFDKIVESSGLLSKILPEDSEKTRSSILSVMTTYIKSLEYLSDANVTSTSNDDKESDIFSIKKWIEDDSQTGFLIIPSRANQHESLKPLISVFLEIAINNLLSLQQNRKRNIWVFLDELPTLHYIPSLQSGLSESRQFGGSFILSLQLMAQLRSIYGRDRAESVSGLCRNRVVFLTPDEETATWCSNSLGKVEIEEINESSSYGSHEVRDGKNMNKQTKIKPLVLPTQIMDLKDLSFYLKFSNGFPVCLNKIKYQDYPEIEPKFLENKNVNQIEEIEEKKPQKKKDLALTKNPKKEGKKSKIKPLEGDDFQVPVPDNDKPENMEARNRYIKQEEEGEEVDEEEGIEDEEETQDQEERGAETTTDHSEEEDQEEYLGGEEIVVEEGEENGDGEDEDNTSSSNNKPKQEQNNDFL